MALHVLKNTNPAWGNVLGSALGEGLSHLAQAKMQKMKTNEDIKLLSSLGIDPLHARFINSLPAEQRTQAVGNYLNAKNQQSQQEQLSREESPLAQTFESAQQQMQQPQQTQDRPSLSNLFNQGTTGSGINPQFLESLRQSPAIQQQQMQAPEQQQLQQAQQNVQQPQIAQPKPTQSKSGKNDILAAALSGGDVKHQEALERQKTAKQNAINRQNTPFLKGLTKAQENAETALNVLNHMEELLNTGKVSSGLFHGNVPSVLQNTESQLFESDANTLAQQLAGQTGVPTGFKIKFAQNLKPKLTDREDTQKKRIQQLKKEAEKVLKKAQLRDELIEENGGEQPANLETLLNKRFKQLESSGKSQDTFNAKPNPALYKGQTIVDEETGEEEISDGKQWVKV